MSAAADQMEADLINQAKGYNAPADQMEADLIQQSQSKPEDQPTDKKGYVGKYWDSLKNSFSDLGKTISNAPGKSALQSIEGVPAALVAPIAHGIGSAAAVAENAISKIPGAQHLGFDPNSTYAKTNAGYQEAIGKEVDPRSDIGKSVSGVLSSAFSPAGDVLSVPGKVVQGAANLVGVSPENAKSAGEQTNAITNAALISYGSRKAAQEQLPPELKTAQEQLNSSYSVKSAGAASTAPDISKTSPEFQQAIQQNLQKGIQPNSEALGRQVRAQSLPVPIELTKGQALGDPALISEEMNNRGKFPQYANRFNEQNKALIDNIQALREQAGPDVYSTNPTEHGDTLIQAYKDKAAVADADITAKYQALKDANGGQFPVDAPTLLQNATQALHKDLLFDHAPKAIMSTLNRLADSNNMTFENFESLRTNLARIQRSMSADGNEKAAAGVIRDAMEQLPLSPTAANLKPLADQARAAAKAQFSALDSDPAYKAAVNDKVTPDQFVHKYVISAPRDALETMQKNLSDNPVAQQTMGVAAIDHLKSAAGIDRQGNGNFSQAMFNKNYEKLEPKLKYVLDPKTADTMQDLGAASRDIQFQPKGSFVNNSNTFTSALAEGTKSSVEGAANVAFGGIPVGTWTRKAASKISEGKKIRESLEPAAGVFAPKKMSDILKSPKKPSK